VLPLFTVQYQLSVSDDPGTNPVVVWVSKYAFSATRADLLSSRWTGERWTPAELVGSLADSAIVTWPDVARTDGTVWATFNRGLGHQTFVQNVFAIRETPPATFSDSVEFSAESRGNGVQLKWSADSGRDIVSFRVLRRRDAADAVPATVIVELPGNRSRGGGHFDRDLPGPGRYLYWMEFVISPEGTLTVGPRSVDFALRTSTGSIDWASSSSRTGTVTVGGVRDQGASQQLMIFDVTGRRVRVLEVGGTASRAGGRFEVTWDGRTESGAPASAGVYFAQLMSHSGGYEATRKVILLR
jgi:FlgD Ig-like domain